MANRGRPAANLKLGPNSGQGNARLAYRRRPRSRTLDDRSKRGPKAVTSCQTAAKESHLQAQAAQDARGGEGREVVHEARRGPEPHPAAVKLRSNCGQTAVKTVRRRSSGGLNETRRR